MFGIRIKIWHKLFIAIVLVMMVVLAINLGLSRIGFQQGFSQYIEEVKLKRLDGLRLELSRLYQQNQGWDFLLLDRKQWHELLLEAKLIPPRPPHRGGPGFRGAPPWPPPPDAPPRRRIGLLDAEQHPIIGPPPSKRLRQLDIKLDGVAVGYLTVDLFRPNRTHLERRFAHQQMENLLITAVISLLVAIVAALLLARLFNRPITKLAEIARQLTEGKFESRVRINGQDEFCELAADLNHLAEVLEQNQSARRRWIADISHELRTPLTVLRGELEALEDGVRPINRDSVQSLSREVKQLKRLVDDLYQLSLSDQGSLSYEKGWIEPVALLKGVTAGFEHSLQQKQLLLTMTCDDEPPRLFADAQRLTQLFTNLMENSQRYTDEGGEVKVWCESRDHCWQFHIEDSPPGVKEDQIGRLFERLYRVEGSRNRAHGGSGLGLSIARSIAEGHGATLSAQPSSLGGVWVTLKFPLEK
ncbi:MAG: HAMP domain-containing protein [Gammaproteobacteria bacterium]|nr:HAMP domain-containing protein [Gammaproteobacteria bacterium]